MPSKKNFIWEEKFLSGGEGVRKKGQISLVKEQKSRELILGEGGS